MKRKIEKINRPLTKNREKKFFFNVILLILLNNKKMVRVKEIQHKRL